MNNKKKVLLKFDIFIKINSVENKNRSNAGPSTTFFLNHKNAEEALDFFNLVGCIAYC